ncbi:hypothetical protein NDU88_006898 [Pleurodeles waltl]|uniref:Uncharacterized protein n=1 Tax=Pleurodeles waltl TaxID=8319 RepID=A0AAV7TZ38_PLEWA|nr:hypothetical protein NDU88_006898 [Pleurodeles waltl]
MLRLEPLPEFPRGTRRSILSRSPTERGDVRENPGVKGLEERHRRRRKEDGEQEDREQEDREQEDSKKEDREEEDQRKEGDRRKRTRPEYPEREKTMIDDCGGGIRNQTPVAEEEKGGEASHIPRGTWLSQVQNRLCGSFSDLLGKAGGEQGGKRRWTGATPFKLQRAQFS